MRGAKKGFGLITALGFIIAVATVGMLALNFVSQSSKRLTEERFFTQASLLAKSATEFAVLRIGMFDKSGGKCLEKLDINASPFEINVTISYLGDVSLDCNSEVNGAIVNDTDLVGTALIDVVVSEESPKYYETTEDGYRVPTTPMRFHKRTIQKP